jgi:glycine/D-amino acid oxidase-like deaminating enzyme
MATARSDTTPYWSTSTTFPQFANFADGDVVVGGGGITGLSAAYLLAKAGKRVILLERGRCAATDTGHTSAHLTMVTDARLSELVKGIGRTHAQAVWDAGLAARNLRTCKCARRGRCGLHRVLPHGALLPVSPRSPRPPLPS